MYIHLYLVCHKHLKEAYIVLEVYLKAFKGNIYKTSHWKV